MREIDLAAYLRRIGHQGSTEPTVETLRALHLAHVTTFPFENLSSWSGHPVSLALADLETKFVRRKRGGYCFEGNTLFAAVLRQLGFKVALLIARVRWMQPPDVDQPRAPTCCCAWKSTANHGSPTSDSARSAKRCRSNSTPMPSQPTPHEPRRFRRENGIVTHQIGIGPDRWEDVYCFDLHEAVPMDFEVANWFVSTHPESLFRHHALRHPAARGSPADPGFRGIHPPTSRRPDRKTPGRR